MTNNYEGLFHQSFQMLCQSLLTLEYPGIQCMPIEMPDGGRDALKGAIVFQVKFARDPQAIDDSASWVISAVEREIPKITTLLEQHAIEKYVMITNMPGTSHLNSGSIDKVQRYLDTNVPLQSQCLWRSDVDRRLDPHPLLKLKYPALITGDDAIALLWALSGASEESSRRENAINAYLAHHYDQDQRVRFKEVGLSSNSLFDLYIDVPASVERDRRHAARHMNAYFQSLGEAAIFKVCNNQPSDLSDAVNLVAREPEAPEDDETVSASEDTIGRADVHSYGHDTTVMVRSSDGYQQVTVGAADMVLGSNFMARNPCVVLEGAPGQGKSTLSQYLMQIQRARLLKKSSGLSGVPSYSSFYPVMLPIKLELRDVALWLRGINPWDPQQQPHQQPCTFESAVSGHIRQYSGGVTFSVADLLETVATMPVLIVLDAFDEVADLDDRRKIVDEIGAATTRLQQRNPNLYFIITSRPTSISKSPRFPTDKYLYLTLMPINRELAMDYATRWAKVRALDERDSEELTDVLQKRLDSPHIAELAKNTMQLTILLWLINLRGPSLPDQRTDLYDTYFTVFMDRESEKDSVVRDRRGLILKLHMYLGFYLHAKAEAKRTTGRISTQDLDTLIAHYLQKEEQPANSLSEVSHAVDRIFALVSRVEGTWEFEVQPLQEYFAGRFLYNSAPYVVSSREFPGTKPIRFDGVAPNPYWLNVTRFFAGCFTDGELLDLCDRIIALFPKEHAFGRTLAVLVLQDWVFAQSIKATRILFEGLFDQIGLRWAGAELRYGSQSPGSARLSLSSTQIAGSERLIKILWPTFNYGIRTQRIYDAASLLRNQVVQSELLSRWLEDVPEENTDRYDRWLDVGSVLNVLRALPPGDVRAMADGLDGHHAERALGLLLRGAASSVELSDEQLMIGGRGLLSAQSAGGIVDGSPIAWFGNPTLWIYLVRAAKSNGSEYRWELSDMLGDLHHFSAGKTSWRTLSGEENLWTTFAEAVQRRSTGHELVEAFRRSMSIMESVYGPTVRQCELACISAAVTRGGDRGSGARWLSDSSRSLTDRMRFARGQVHNAIWWREQLSGLNSEYDRYLWALAIWAWAGPEVLSSLVGEFETVVAGLSSTDKSALVGACNRADMYGRSAALLAEAASSDVLEFSDSIAISILANRMQPDDRETLAMKVAEKGLKGPNPANMVWISAGKIFLSGKLSAAELVDLGRKCHDAGCFVESGIRNASRRDMRGIGSDWVQIVIEESYSLPSDVIFAAYRALDLHQSQPVPVLDLATRENWFDGDNWGRV